ncbi:TRAP transporter small permease [Vallitalea okinawensis]|uniref:TRAP transporter small permease n=1 Tax=Vallitalea okinawensis TaxID=2078660 RepID=UPI000CFC4D44|nr:TRAP transporter small permease subunit [Vallitalea okinawensis]
MNILAKIDKVIDASLKSITLICLITLFILLSLNVFFRFVPVYSMGWFDEIVELSFAYLSFFGAAFLWKRRDHSRIDFIVEKYSNTKIEYFVELGINILGLIFVLFLFWFSMDLIARATAWSPIFKISRKVFYLCLPLSAAVMAIYAFKDIIIYTALLFGKDLRSKEAYNDY